jgi:hypothetical protein
VLRLLAQPAVWAYVVRMANVTSILRSALMDCGETRYAVSKATGIPESTLSRFAMGKPLRGENIDKLSSYLGLELRPKAGNAKPRKGR